MCLCMCVCVYVCIMCLLLFAFGNVSIVFGGGKMIVMPYQGAKDFLT